MTCHAARPMVTCPREANRAIRRAALGVLVTALAWGANAPALAQTAQQVVQRVQAAVVGIAVTPLDGSATQGDASARRSRETTDDALASATLVTPAGQAVGSGTLVSADGLIVTSASLFEPAAERIVVTLADGSRLAATLVGADKRSNIALLRIDRSGLTYLEPRVDLPLTPGARVLALGRTTIEPDSFVTVTDGMLSAVVPGSGGYSPLLQSTAQTLPSMGGGPLLLEATGEFIGLNSQRLVLRSGPLPLTFATPLSIYPRVARDLLRTGRVERAVLGLGAVAMTDDISTSLGLPKGEGVLLTSVRPASPAGRAGLEPGDVVLAVNGRTVVAIGDLFGAIDAAPPGTVHTLRYFHRGQVLTIQAASELAPPR